MCVHDNVNTLSLYCHKPNPMHAPLNYPVRSRFIFFAPLLTIRQGSILINVLGYACKNTTATRLVVTKVVQVQRYHLRIFVRAGLHVLRICRSSLLGDPDREPGGPQLLHLAPPPPRRRLPLPLVHGLVCR
jgi:hypothetical protein